MAGSCASDQNDELHSQVTFSSRLSQKPWPEALKQEEKGEDDKMSFYGNLQPNNRRELPGISPRPLLKVESSLFKETKSGDRSVDSAAPLLQVHASVPH